MAMAIGNQVGVAVENWVLSRTADRRNEEMKTLHRVGEALRTTFDMQAQIGILRKEMSGLLGGTNFPWLCRIWRKDHSRLSCRLRMADRRMYPRAARQFPRAVRTAIPAATPGDKRRSPDRGAIGIAARGSSNQDLERRAP